MKFSASHQVIHQENEEDKMDSSAMDNESKADDATPRSNTPDDRKTSSGSLKSSPAKQSSTEAVDVPKSSDEGLQVPTTELVSPKVTRGLLCQLLN